MARKLRIRADDMLCFRAGWRMGNDLSAKGYPAHPMSNRMLAMYYTGFKIGNAQFLARIVKKFTL